MKNELYASLELQITMTQDYSEWLKQETKRNDELLNAHSTALRRLNGLMVQSPSGEENVDSGRGEELPDGLKWKDAPEWAEKLAIAPSRTGKWHYVWCNSCQYMYIETGDVYLFTNGGRTFESLHMFNILATQPEEV